MYVIWHLLANNSGQINVQFSSRFSLKELNVSLLVFSNSSIGSIRQSRESVVLLIKYLKNGIDERRENNQSWSNLNLINVQLIITMWLTHEFEMQNFPNENKLDPHYTYIYKNCKL